MAKVNAAGTALVYAGYIGGGVADYGYGIAVDGAGNAYVTGFTDSDETTFPVTVGPDLTYNGGVYDAFVAKVNAAGTALVYCGYIGGSGDDVGYGIAVDGSGNAYVTGYTTSTETTFPVTVGPDLTYNGGSGRLRGEGQPGGHRAALLPATSAAADADQGNGIAVDGAGNAYVTGYTTSTEATFPVHGRAGPDLQRRRHDAFVAKVNAGGHRARSTPATSAAAATIRPRHRGGQRRQRLRHGLHALQRDHLPGDRRAGPDLERRPGRLRGEDRDRPRDRPRDACRTHR